MKWTEDQLKAIETRKKNLLVSAAAGSGKTALLIERIRRIVVEEKTSVDALLVLTFTRSAAAEMKERLSAALMAELEREGVDSDFVIAQISRLGAASISTLHAFCNNLVKDYFQEGGIDPEFKLGNETELSIMVQEALEELFEEKYQEIPPDGGTPFSRLVDMFTGNRDDRELKSLVENFHYFLVTQPDSENWCERALSYFDLDAEGFWKSPWGHELDSLIRTDMEGAYELLEKAYALCRDYEGFEKTAAQLQEDFFAAGLAIDALEEGYDDFRKALSGIRFARYSGNKKADAETSDRIKDLRNEAKGIIQGLQKRLNLDLSEALAQLSEMRQPMADLVALTRDFQKKYHEKKVSKTLLDFNDLEQSTLRILKNSAIADELKERYEYVFLDEYQDTNDMQEAIIRRIVRDDNYFMVGDVKQSIYRFRLADPTIFIEKYHAFSQKTDAFNDLITLSQNFRSCQGVVDGVNGVFEAIMSPELGEIEYDGRARLYKGLDNEGPYVKTQVHIIENKTDEDTDPIVGEMPAVEMEARFIAREIQSRVGKPVFDTKTGEERLLQYRDIGVLMRSVAGRGDIYAKIFSELGIPAYFDGGEQYYESMEIGVVMNLLDLIDNHHQDLPLLSVMTSPIGDFNTEECTEIRLFQKEGSYYAAAEKYKDEREDALASKLKAFYARLDAWQWDSRVMDIEDFLWKLYLDTGYYHFVGALPGGEQRQSNLRVLLKRAGDYKRSTLRGLFYFIRFIERMKKHKYDMSPPGVLSESENVVRIMTVHKSKGLEFPVVFLSGVGKLFNKRTKNREILFHKDLGICPDYINLELRAKMPTLAKNICLEKNELETLSEEMRLLYVAMTRARESLVVVGVVKNLDSRLTAWSGPGDLYHLKKAGGLLDWIMQALLKNGVPEIMEEEKRRSLSLPNYEVYFYTAEQSLQQHISEETVEELVEEAETPPEAMWQEVCRRLSYRYPFAGQQELPGKMTVTEVKRLRTQAEALGVPEIPERVALPSFMVADAREITGAEKGTALHFMMQNLPLNRLRQVVDDPEAFDALLKEEQERLITEELLLPELARTIDLEVIRRFFQSELGRRMLAAERVRREVPFNYQYDPRKVLPDWQNADAPLVVQGMIDCCFEENGKWILLDYKTDRYFDEAGRQQLIDQYRLQINFYAEALANLTGMPVAERILCLVVMGEQIKVDR